MSSANLSSSSFTGKDFALAFPKASVGFLAARAAKGSRRAESNCEALIVNLWLEELELHDVEVVSSTSPLDGV